MPKIPNKIGRKVLKTRFKPSLSKGFVSSRVFPKVISRKFVDRKLGRDQLLVISKDKVKHCKRRDKGHEETIYGNVGAVAFSEKRGKDKIFWVSIGLGSVPKWGASVLDLLYYPCWPGKGYLAGQSKNKRIEWAETFIRNNGLRIDKDNKKYYLISQKILKVFSYMDKNEKFLDLLVKYEFSPNVSIDEIEKLLKAYKLVT